jgi:isopenicillin-N epimerase
VRPVGPDAPWEFEAGVTYLNHGSFGACPAPVLERQRELMDHLEANAIRFLDRDLETTWDSARRGIAEFLHADPEGLVAIPNATSGVATVLASLRFRPGDELLTTDHEYNATLNALAATADANRARVVIARLPLPIRHPAEATEAILAAVTPRTRLAMVSHVTSPTGLVLPIHSIVAELDRLGIDTLVDGAHAPGMVPLDLAGLGAAYWTGNGHKWLCAPKVAGLLHVRADRRDRIRPLVTSHGYNDPRRDRPPLWKAFDWPGTHDPTPWLVLPAAIELLGGLVRGGWPALMDANRDLAIEARSLLLDLLGDEPICPETMLGAMAAVWLGRVSTDEEAVLLQRSLAEEARIEVAIGGWPVRAARARPDAPPAGVYLRISAQRYNERRDYELLVDALRRRGFDATARRRTGAAGQPRLS